VKHLPLVRYKENIELLHSLKYRGGWRNATHLLRIEPKGMSKSLTPRKTQRGVVKRDPPAHFTP